MRLRTSIYSIVIALLFFQPSYSQDSLDALNKQLDTLENQIDYEEIIENYNPNVPINRYYSIYHLSIANDISSQVENILESYSNNDKTSVNEEALFNVLTLEAKIEEKKTFLNKVSKKNKFEGEDFINPNQLLSDKKLLSHHFALLRFLETYYDNLQSPTSEPLKQFVNQKIALIEAELDTRKLYPKTIDVTSNELLARRYQAIREINILGIEEAKSNVDVTIDQTISKRKQLNDLAIELDQIHKDLNLKVSKDGKAQKYFTLETQNRRLEILTRGYKDLDIKNKVQRQSGDLTQYLEVIEEQIIAEKKHIYLEQKHKTINQSIKTRGPPDLPSSSKIEIDKPIKPLFPSGNQGLALENYLNKTSHEKFRQQSKKQSLKGLKTQYDKFKAIIPSKTFLDFEAAINTRKISTLPKREFSIFTERSNTKYDLLKHSSASYYESLASADLQKAIVDKANFNTEKKLYNVTDKNITPQDFLSDYEKNRLKQRLQKIKRSLEVEKSKGGIFAAPWLDDGIKLYAKEIKDLASKRPRLLESGELVSRPPPMNEEVNLKFNTQKLKTIEIVKAKFGADFSSSLSQDYAAIKTTLNTNKVSGLHETAKKYISEKNYYDMLQSLPEELRANYDKEIADFKSKEKKLLASIEKLENQKSFTDGSLPQKMTEDFKKVKKVISKPEKAKVNVEKDLPIKVKPDIEKLKSMTSAKTPGGIWLTPEKKFIVPEQRLEFQQNWKEIDIDEQCFIEEKIVVAEWMIDESNKVCFYSTNIIQENPYHELKPLQ